MIYWAGGNPFHHHQDINRLLAAWRRPDTVVVHEIWWTATARHADIVLPATTTLERNDLGAASRDSYLVAMKQAVDPVGDARNDHDILADLAERLGFREQFTAGLDEAQWLRALYGEAREAGRRHDIDLPGFDTFWADGVAHVWTGKQKVLLEDFRNDPGRYHRRLRLPRLSRAPGLAGAGRMARFGVGPAVPAAPHLQPAGHPAALPARHGPGQQGQQGKRPGAVPDELRRRRGPLDP
jgi:anaerobic selenocysteine-containing dehydrogenase